MNGRCRISREVNAYFCSTEEHVSEPYSVPAGCRFRVPTVCSTTTGLKCLCSTVPIDFWLGYTNVPKFKKFPKMSMFNFHGPTNCSNGRKDSPSSNDQYRDSISDIESMRIAN